MSFLSALTEAQDGLVVHTLDQRFAELREAVLSHKSKGSITIKCVVTPSKRNERGEVIMVELDFLCDVKKPALQPGNSSFFVDDDGNLCRNPPGQMTIRDMVDNAREGR